MESDVLRELYEKYHQKAYLYVLSLCRDRETAEDIVSEGFEKAFLTVEGCPEGFFWWLLLVWVWWVAWRFFFVGWVWGVFCFLGLHPRPTPPRQGGEMPAEIPVPEDALSGVLQKEENRRLYTAMNRLSPADRELLIWHYFGELSIRQMAGLRGISETAVKTALFRARARLKQKLGGEKP